MDGSNGSQGQNHEIASGVDGVFACVVWWPQYWRPHTTAMPSTKLSRTDLAAAAPPRTGPHPQAPHKLLSPEMPQMMSVPPGSHTRSTVFMYSTFVCPTNRGGGAGRGRGRETGGWGVGGRKAKRGCKNGGGESGWLGMPYCTCASVSRQCAFWDWRGSLPGSSQALLLSAAHNCSPPPTCSWSLILPQVAQSQRRSNVMPCRHPSCSSATSATIHLHMGTQGVRSKPGTSLASARSPHQQGSRAPGVGAWGVLRGQGVLDGTDQVWTYPPNQRTNAFKCPDAVAAEMPTLVHEVAWQLHASSRTHLTLPRMPGRNDSLLWANSMARGTRSTAVTESHCMAHGMHARGLSAWWLRTCMVVGGRQRHELRRMQC